MANNFPVSSATPYAQSAVGTNFANCKARVGCASPLPAKATAAPSTVPSATAPKPWIEPHNLTVALDYTRHGLAVSRACGGAEPDGVHVSKSSNLPRMGNDLGKEEPAQLRQGRLEAPVTRFLPGSDAPETDPLKIRDMWSEFPGSLPAISLGQEVIVLDFDADKLAEAQAFLSEYAGSGSFYALLTPLGDLRVVFRIPAIPPGTQRVTDAPAQFPGAMRITDKVVLEGAVLDNTISSEPYRLIEVGQPISLRAGDPVSAIPEAPPALLARLGIMFEDIPAPPAVPMAEVALDFDDRILIREAIALGIAVEVISFASPTPAVNFTSRVPPDDPAFDWLTSARPLHEIGPFEPVGQDGRIGARQRPSMTSHAMLASVPAILAEGGHIITAGLFDQSASLVHLTPPYFFEGAGKDVAAIAAAIGMPLDRVIVASLDGECEAIGFVVDAASLDAVFAEAGELRTYAADLRHDDRLILPGNRMGTRTWTAPAGKAAFLQALAGPPAKATQALARALSGGSRRLLEIVSEHEHQGVSEPWSDDGDITLASKPSAKAPMILDGFIPRVGFGILTGPSQAGKTWALASLFAHIAQGASVAGIAAAEALTVHLTADDTHDDFLKRIQGFLHHHGLSGAPYIARSVRDVPLKGQTGGLNLLNPDHVEAVIAYVRGQQAKHAPTSTILAIETMSKTMGDGDPVNFRDVNRYQAALETISRALGAAVIATHHPTKGGSSEYSGHGSIFNGADFLIVASTKGSDGIVLTAEKLKAGRDGATLSGRRTSFDYIDGNGHEVLSCVMAWERATPPKEPFKTSALQSADPDCCTASETPQGAGQAREAALLRAVRECIKREAIEYADEGRAVLAAKMEAVREAFRVLVFGDAETKSDTLNKAFRRAKDALTAGGSLRVSPEGLLWMAP